jgi:peroxiredoxin
MQKGRIKLGEQVPWFETRTMAGAPLFLGTVGGHWVVLSFFDGLTPERTQTVVDALLAESTLYKFGHMAWFGVFTSPPRQADDLVKKSEVTLGFVPDYDGDITRSFGAEGSPRLLVLDPMLNVVGNYPLDGEAPIDNIRAFLRSLPPVDRFAGVSLVAPVLIAPHIFEEAVCGFLIKMYEENGGTESGTLQNKNGLSASVINHDHKSRRDYIISDPGVREFIRERVVQRLLPMIMRYFQYKPTRMDRQIVSCYDVETGGHFSRHRDTSTIGARHRRFAVSINLNLDYDGCDLVFPEFGTRTYRAPLGGAIVFSAELLHEVNPITRGKRYAFLPFLYGEEEALQRKANNAYLAPGEEPYNYESGLDKLYPDG